MARSDKQKVKRVTVDREDEMVERDPERERSLPVPMSIEIGAETVEEAIETVANELTYWARRGIDSKVRIKFRGTQLIPDVPLAAFMVAEGALFWFGGLLRALAFNVGGGTVLNIEFISNALPFIARS